MVFDIRERNGRYSSTVGLDKAGAGHTEGAIVRFHVSPDYPTGSPPEYSLSMSWKTEYQGMKCILMTRGLSA